jgi:hypothetical protein
MEKQTENYAHIEQPPQEQVPTLSDDEVDSIMRGIRPEGMDFEDFKMYRREFNKRVKNHLNGRWFFVSSTLVTGEDGIRYRETKTYVKEKGNKDV